MFSIWDDRLENFENLFKRYSERKIKGINNSLIRPLYQEILRCLYLIIVIIFDTFILLEFIQNILFPLKLILSIFFVILLLFFENKIYNRIWGKNGKWSLDKYKK